MPVSHPPFKPCPCGSKRSFQTCCGPLLSGERQASTAEQLMRSRYTGYALRDEAYLLHTWHPSTRPASLDLGAAPTRWEGLTVHATSAGQAKDLQGTVEFTARYRVQGERHQMRECSRFIKEERWLYVDGDSITP